jgi:3-dehydroquinate synthetase
MRMDAEIAKRKGLCDNSMIELIARLLETFHLPSNIPFQAETLMEKIAGDKKKRENHIRYILPVSPGDCRIVRYG